jgi:hypothetical protein
VAVGGRLRAGIQADGAIAAALVVGHGCKACC